MSKVIARPAYKFVHPEYGDLTAEVYAELTAMIQADHEAALEDIERSQQQIAQNTPGPAAIRNGFALKAQIDPRVVSYWRMREGSQFWRHELDNFLKKNPNCRVQQVSARPTVRVQGLRDRPSVTGRRGRWAA